MKTQIQEINQSYEKWHVEIRKTKKNMKVKTLANPKVDNLKTFNKFEVLKEETKCIQENKTFVENLTTHQRYPEK